MVYRLVGVSKFVWSFNLQRPQYSNANRVTGIPVQLLIADMFGG